MLGGHDEDQFVEQSSCDALLAGPKRVPADDPEVHLVPANPLLDEGGVVDTQAQRYLGVSLLECCNDAGEHIDPGRRAGADDQRATLELAEVGDGLAGTRQRGEESKSVLLEDPAGFGQGHLPSEAVEQPRAQLALHLGHVLGKGGLAQMHGLGGGTETPRLGHGQEHLKLPKRRLHKPYLIRRITTSNWSLCKGTLRLGPVEVVRSEPGIRLMVFVTAFLLLAAGEALIPRRARSVARRWRWPTNMTLVVLNTLVIRAVLPLTAVGMGVIAEQRGWGLLHAVGPIRAVLAVAVAIVLLDFAIYLQHLLFHAVPVLWRVHRVHHADIDMDVTTGSRFHPIEIFLSLLIKLATISALGASPMAVLLFEALLNAGSLFNHANLRLPLGLDRVLRFVVVTPDMHRVHHSAWGVETNTNFGFTFPWWDHLCGTYRAQPTAGHEAMLVGLTCFRDPKYLRFGITLLQPLLDGNGSQASVSDHPQDQPPMRSLTQRD
jgi:sterol desaturase/sphingolipid hydroxylase (fatty acid hydroxylase superfamily)